MGVIDNHAVAVKVALAKYLKLKDLGRSTIEGDSPVSESFMS